MRRGTNRIHEYSGLGRILLVVPFILVLVLRGAQSVGRGVFAVGTAIMFRLLGYGRRKFDLETYRVVARHEL